MNNIFQVQVRRRGIITLPKELRDRNQIQERARLTLTDLGNGVMIMSPRRSQVDELADNLARQWQDSGETLESLQATLREIRAEFDTKKR